MAVVFSCARQEERSLQQSPDQSSLQSESVARSESEVEKISFSQWCERWGLSCPTKTHVNEFESVNLQGGQIEASDDEALADSRQLKRWQAISKLVTQFSTSGSQLSIEDTELSNAKTRLLMTQIGLQDVYAELLDLIQRARVRKVFLDSEGKLRFESRLASGAFSGIIRGRSGLKWLFENQGTMAVDAASGQYSFEGLSFAAANGVSSESFRFLSFNDADQSHWAGRELTVTHIPAGFIARDLPVRWEKLSEIQREKLLRGTTELRNVLLNSNRNIRLNRSFFDTAARAMPVFINDSKLLPALTTLTDALGGLEIKAPLGNAPIAQVNLEKANGLMCRMEMSGTPTMEFYLDKNFGVQNVFTNEKFNAQIDLYGITVKAKAGISVSFKLRRVDVEPTRIVVKGVPVVGEVVIPQGKSDKELKKFECSERF
jgi:hypothetical protein